MLLARAGRKDMPDPHAPFIRAFFIELDFPNVAVNEVSLSKPGH